MVESQRIGVVGASARAAVHSLARAGFGAWAVDLFADRDLARVAPCAVCPTADYPAALAELAKPFEPGPVMYTGGLENHAGVVAELSADRELWGNGPDVLLTARDPFFISRALEPRGMNMTFPDVRSADAPPTIDYPGMRWLLKPRAGAAGHGIRFWAHGDALPARPERWYFQEFIEGSPVSAVFMTHEWTVLLGVTEQLVGTAWLHAPPFGYAGNIGPVNVNPTFWYIVDRMGETLAKAAGLRGVWGMDFIQDGDTGTYPVEVNPRYTASVEVLEHATGVAVFGDRLAVTRPSTTPAVGKGVYFAPHDLTFPASGPWDADLAGDFDPWRLPAFADIPAPGSRIPAGQPVLTILVSGASPAGCRDRLQSRAAELDRLLGVTQP